MRTPTLVLCSATACYVYAFGALSGSVCVVPNDLFHSFGGLVSPPMHLDACYGVSVAFCKKNCGSTTKYQSGSSETVGAKYWTKGPLNPFREIKLFQ